MECCGAASFVKVTVAASKRCRCSIAEVGLSLSQSVIVPVSSHKIHVCFEIVQACEEVHRIKKLKKVKFAGEGMEIEPNDAKIQNEPKDAKFAKVKNESKDA